MASKQYYSFSQIEREKTTIDPIESFSVGKLDEDLEVIDSYRIDFYKNGQYKCNCPSRAQPCKHVKLVKFCRINQGKINTNIFTMKPYGADIRPIEMEINNE